MVGNLTKPSFQWDRFRVKRPPESTGIVETSSRPESVRVLRDSYWAFRIRRVLGPCRGASKGTCTSLGLYIP